MKTGLSPERMQLSRLSRVFRKRLLSYVLTRCQRFAFQSPNVSKNGDKRNGHTFDPLGSNVSILSSNNQLLALHNGCQEVVSKGVLDRFVRLSQPSIILTFNTLEANNKNQQLSRGSKLVNAHQYVTGKTLMKSQTSARRIKNSISTLFRGAECFRLVRSFRTAWVIVCIDLSLALLDIGLSPVVLRWSFFGLSMHWPSSDISLHRPFSRDCLRWLSSIPSCEDFSNSLGDRESAVISFKHLGAGHLQNVRGK